MTVYTCRGANLPMSPLLHSKTGSWVKHHGNHWVQVCDGFYRIPAIKTEKNPLPRQQNKQPLIYSVTTTTQRWGLGQGGGRFTDHTRDCRWGHEGRGRRTSTLEKILEALSFKDPKLYFFLLKLVHTIVYSVNKRNKWRVKTLKNHQK